jgi:hypothetical protein
MMLVVVLILTLLLVAQGLRLFQQDLAFTAAETELSFWGRENYQPLQPAIVRTGQRIDALLQQNPQHSSYLELHAYYLSWLGFWTDDVEQRFSFNDQAMQTQYRALQTRPADRQAWLKMVEYSARTVDGEALLAEAQSRARALGPALY